jgi:hypothetical protein
MKRQKRIAGVWAILAVFAISFSSPVALAATSGSSAPTSNAGQALEIAPPVINLSANPGETVKAQISLRDVSSSSLKVTGQVNDFVAAGEDGTPKILLEDKDNNPFSIKSWIAPLPVLTLVPREIKTLTVTLKVPSNAAPGGHYGVVRFTGSAPDVNGTGVALSASLGALILVTVKGKAKESLTVQEFAVLKDGKKSKLFESAPVTFLVRLKNSGNIHEQPAGQISVTDMFGKKIANVNVNLPPRNILPDSIRRFESPLDKAVIGNKKLFGRYTAELNVTYGASKQSLKESITFWVIPYKLMAVAILLLIGGFFLLRALIRRYNQQIIRKARNSR